MKLWGGLFALAAGLNIILGLHAWPAVLAGSLNDPDSYMRLLRIEQGIAQGHLVNVVARDDSGAGVLVEWSRLLDMLLWLMAAPLALLIGWHKALFVAGVALGPLGVGVLGVSLAFAARPFAEDGLLWAAAIAAAMLPGLLTFAAPGVVHYHILLVALIALSVGCVPRAWRGGEGFAFLSGMFGGFAIWLTPETMPFILMGFAALLLRWVLPGKPFGKSLVLCGAGIFDVLCVALTVDPPQGGYGIAEIDRLSLVYAVLALFLLLGTVMLWRLDQWPRAAARRGTGAAVMALFLLAWIALFPGVAQGPYGIMSPQDMRRFFGVMQELQPLRGPVAIVSFLVPGLLAFAYTLWRAFDARGVGLWLWLYVALCTLITLILADRFTLFVEFTAAVAAGLAPVMLSEASQRFRARPAAAMLARLAIMAALFILPDIPAFAAHKPPAVVSAKSWPSCDLRQIGPFLAPYKGDVVLAEAQYSPELLYRTDILTVGSLYQHGLAGYFRAWNAWRSPPGTAVPPAVTAAGAKLILFCPAAERYAVVRDIAGTTLWDALQAGAPPPWAKLTATDPATGWRLFTIAK